MRETRKLLRSGHTRPEPTSRRSGRRVDGRATPEPNRAEIPAAAQSTCDDTGGPRSIDQPLNSASFHSVEGMHNIALVEHGEQALDSVHRVVLARCDIFRQDATRILHRAQYRFLIGRVQTELLAQQNRELKWRPTDSFQSIWCANRRSVARYNALPQLRPRCATRACRCKGRGCKPMCLPIDRVKVNPGPRAGLKSLCRAGAVPFRKQSR
jgi:hypothetical protein